MARVVDVSENEWTFANMNWCSFVKYVSPWINNLNICFIYKLMLKASMGLLIQTCSQKVLGFWFSLRTFFGIDVLLDANCSLLVELLLFLSVVLCQTIGVDCLWLQAWSQAVWFYNLITLNLGTNFLTYL